MLIFHSFPQVTESSRTSEWRMAVRLKLELHRMQAKDYNQMYFTFDWPHGTLLHFRVVIPNAAASTAHIPVYEKHRETGMFWILCFPLGPGLSLGRKKRMKTKKADKIRAVWVLDWLWFCSSWTHLNSMGDIQTAWVTANKCRPVNSCRWLQWNVCSPFAEVPQLHRAEGALQQGVPWPCREDPSPEDAVTTDIWARPQPSAPHRKK